MPDPKKNVAYVFNVTLVSQADATSMQANPTIAAGDFQHSGNDSALTNLATLPTVSPAGGKLVKISLSAAEMNYDRVNIVCSDAAGAEWCDLAVLIDTTVVTVDDLVRATTPANTLDVSATGGVDVDTLAAGSITAATIGTGAIDADALATDAVTEIADGVGAHVVEGTTTVDQSLRLANSANAGKVSGAGTTNVKLRDLADTKDRVDATVDAAGNRTAVTRNVT